MKVGSIEELGIDIPAGHARGCNVDFYWDRIGSPSLFLVGKAGVVSPIHARTSPGRSLTSWCSAGETAAPGAPGRLYYKALVGPPHPPPSLRGRRKKEELPRG